MDDISPRFPNYW